VIAIEDENPIPSNFSLSLLWRRSREETDNITTAPWLRKCCPSLPKPFLGRIEGFDEDGLNTLVISRVGETKMKMTAFLGSPRAGGNTDTITSRVLDGARESGCEVEKIALRNLKIRGCIGCDRCWQNGKKCAIDDDMTALYDTIAGSNILLFSTPVYWYAPTALMKAFIDRFVIFNRPPGKPLIEGKSAIIVTAYEEEGPAAAEPLLKMFHLSLDYLGVKLIDTIAADGLGPKDAILGKPEILENAYKLGLSLR